MKFSWQDFTGFFSLVMSHSCFLFHLRLCFPYANVFRPTPPCHTCIRYILLTTGFLPSPFPFFFPLLHSRRFPFATFYITVRVILSPCLSTFRWSSPPAPLRFHLIFILTHSPSPPICPRVFLIFFALTMSFFPVFFHFPCISARSPFLLLSAPYSIFLSVLRSRSILPLLFLNSRSF